MLNRWLVIAVLCIAFSVILAMSDGGDDGGDDGTGTTGDGTYGTGDESLAQTVQQLWANAIQEFEGFYPGSRSYRDNNPGNLEETGDLGNDGPYAKFSSFAMGEAALVADLTAKIAKYPGQTLLQIMNRYAPAQDRNNPLAYAQYIADQLTGALGQLITPNTTMSQLGSMGGGD
jgi:hypothetical protein